MWAKADIIILGLQQLWIVYELVLSETSIGRNLGFHDGEVGGVGDAAIRIHQHVR